MVKIHAIWKDKFNIKHEGIYRNKDLDALTRKLINMTEKADIETYKINFVGDDFI